MQLKITTSYRTSSQCSDGSYALIGGANLTLEYNYGHNYSRVRRTLPTILFSVIISKGKIYSCYLL